jgi:PAS domain S-box-containing protein
LGERLTRLLLGAIGVTICSEFSFTLYAHPYGLANMAGHLFKVASFFLLYRALIVEGLERPLENLGRTLRRERQRYAQMVETVQEGIWMLDEKGRIRFANRKAADMLGWGVSEMFGRYFPDFLAEADKAVMRRRVEGRPKENRPQSDLRMRRKDGSFLWVMVSAATISDPETGRRANWVMVADITERKRAEEALRQREEQYRTFVANAAEGVFMVGLKRPIDVVRPTPEQVDDLYR